MHAGVSPFSNLWAHETKQISPAHRTPTTAVVILALLPVQAALSLLRSLSSLGQFSILADACTVLAVATVVKQDLHLLAVSGVTHLLYQSAQRPLSLASDVHALVTAYSDGHLTLKT